jgi:hypothetical protein
MYLGMWMDSLRFGLLWLVRRELIVWTCSLGLGALPDENEF